MITRARGGGDAREQRRDEGAHAPRLDGVEGAARPEAGGAPAAAAASVRGWKSGIHTLRRRAAGTAAAPPGWILPHMGAMKRA